jgi:hypothetical protein
MKKLITLTILFFCVSNPVWGEEKLVSKVIQPDLEQALSQLKKDEFLRIIIRLQDQMHPGARRALLASSHDKRFDRNYRRKAITAALRAYAKDSQRPVLNALKRLERQNLVKNIRPLWISNVIGLEAQKGTIEEIVKLGGIEYIKQDIKRPALMQVPAWSVNQINADNVWTNPGLTGNGVVVAVIDTGMDLDHPDLINRLWINAGEDTNGDGRFTAADNNNSDDDGNGYIDDVVGWDLENNDNNPDDWHGHGTHVSGTIAGDGTGGTATGVAPGARLIVLAYSATIGVGQTEAWEGMQYALDNGADIVNLSSGWKDTWAPDYKTWRDNTDVLTDAGVLFVVAAGNDTPHVAAPGDVLTPARAPRALALGATDNTDTIAGFSGQGPTSWQTVAGYNDYIHPPGLLKPDVSAPGVSVNSTQNGGGYVNGPIWSGTSMAAPHAAGTAALLLEEDSTLLPHELMYIIRETAADQGTAGPDNVYGYGRIDALAAVNLVYNHTPVYDLSVTGTNAIWTTTDIWVDNNDDGTPDDPVANTNNHLYARIRNIGGQAVGNAEIKFYYADVGTVGISGFDPDNDGDPDDGNFNYIDSYFVPVIGPAGSSQDTMVGVVHWNVPTPTTDHWCVGIGIVAPNPPNAVEANRTNNKAFRNFFNIIIAYDQVYTFKFYVYPHPMQPEKPFDLQIIRRDLPKEFGVEFAIEQPIAKDWFQRVQGFEPVKKRFIAGEEWRDEELTLQHREIKYDYLRMTEDRGILGRIATPKGKPVLVGLMIQAPSRRLAEKMKPVKGDQLLVINAVNGKGAFGGLTLKVDLDRGRGKVEKPKLQLYQIKVKDAIEAGLVKQEIGLVPERFYGGTFYYYGDREINNRLREFGYEPTVADPNELTHQYILVAVKDPKVEMQKAGLRVLRRRDQDWIVQATPQQIRFLEKAGYTIIKEVPGEEIRPRQVKIYLGNKEDFREVAPYLDDYYNISHDEKRGLYVVTGAAWEDMIGELREKGYSVVYDANGGP